MSQQNNHWHFLHLFLQGILSKDFELKVLMRALGFDVKKPEIIKMVHGEHFLLCSLR